MNYKTTTAPAEPAGDGRYTFAVSDGDYDLENDRIRVRARRGEPGMSERRADREGRRGPLSAPERQNDLSCGCGDDRPAVADVSAWGGEYQLGEQLLRAAVET